MKHEYHEGPQAGESFKKPAAVVLRSQKTTVSAKPKPAKKASRKVSGKGMAQNGNKTLDAHVAAFADHFAPNAHNGH